MFEALAIGPFLFWTRLAFLLLGISLAASFLMRLAQSAQLSLGHFQEFAKWYLLSFLLCGRALAIIADYRVYLKEPLRVFVVWDGGFSFLGGAIGVAVVLWWVTRLHRATFLQWLDVLLPATCFGLFFDWLGKFFSGIAYGKPTDVFWGVTYDNMSVRYAVPLQPVQLYYALFYLFLTFLLLIIRKHEKRAGSETLVGIILASIVTFFFEYFRGDFGIPVFATRMDFFVLIVLFVSLGVFASIERSISRRTAMIYSIALFVVFGTYLVLRNMLEFESIELRFSQFLAVIALLATIVYVLVHRRRYPHL